MYTWLIHPCGNRGNGPPSPEGRFDEILVLTGFGMDSANACSSSIDLENIKEHEFGHVPSACRSSCILYMNMDIYSEGMSSR